jgi:3-dehydroquinate synthase
MSAVTSIKNYYINIAPDKKYTIAFGENAHLAINKNDIGQATRALIITNTTIESACADALAKFSGHLELTVHMLVMEDGETAKTLDTVSTIIDACIAYDLGRKDVIIAFGGGVIGDMAGFAAAVYLRGISFIQVPTSLLAQVDAAIGGKTGVNHSQGKNLIGSFYQPVKTVVDPTRLKSLNKEQMKEGLAEIIKYGVIMDKPLFWYIEQHMDAIRTFSYTDCPDVWNFLIEKSIQNKALVVSQDEKETQYREILNFGHTIAHAIEACSKYSDYSHGEAVATGMIIESLMAVQLRHLSCENYDRIKLLIQSFNFKLTMPKCSITDFSAAIKRDKKIRKGELRFIFPTDIGQTKSINGVGFESVNTAIAAYFGHPLS